MAILRIDELKDGARYMHWDLDNGRSYQRKFRVLTDSFNDGPRVVFNAFAQKFGDIYAPSYNPAELDKLCYVNSYSIDEETNDGVSWIITLYYGWRNPVQAGGGADNNPLAMPIDVSWDFRDHAIALERDINGKAVTNTAGDPFDPPLEVDDPRLMMTVVRNEAVYPLQLVATYRNAINSDPFGGFDPYYSKVLNIQARNLWNQDVGWYYQVTYQFEFMCPKVNDVSVGFRKQILSQGCRAINVVTGKIYHVTIKGVPVNSPVLLDRNGYAILGRSTDSFFIETQAYPELPFGVFDFDPNAISGQRSGLGYVAPSPPG